MKIAIISPRDPIPIYTGLLERIYQTANILSKYHEVKLFFPAEPRKKESGRIPKHINFERIPFSSKWINYFYPKLQAYSNLKAIYNLHLWAYSSLKKKLEIFSPEVIDIELPFLYPLTLLCNKKMKVPIVVSEHLIQYLIYNKKSVMNNFLKKYEIFVLKNASHIVTVSKADKEDISKYVSRSKISICPNGVDINYYHPNMSKYSRDIKKKYGISGPLVVFHGSLIDPPNRVAINVIRNKILPFISKKYPDIIFMIIGANPPKINHPNIIFTGLVDNLPAYLAAADVAIDPVLESTGAEIKILEYLACGVPTVVSNMAAKGIDLLVDKENVLIADDINKNFSNLIIRVLEDPMLRKEIILNGRKLVEEKYSWEKVISKYEVIFQTVVYKNYF
ncbi:MAG: glycosyltransferase family 4 protein [Candidatus Hodarchaeota archaeon]